jgi:formate hydrogenlyase transcriptional activator
MRKVILRARLRKRSGAAKWLTGEHYFHDEVGEVLSALQPKLLRVLHEQEFERLGNGRTSKTDVRLIAATNRNLVKMVSSGANQRSRNRARRCPDLR